MPFTITMPKLSPTMEKGILAKWHKKVGDFVAEGDVVFEVTTDKATMEHTALDAGYLRKILVQEGESASINEPLAIFTEKQEESIEGFSVVKSASPSVAETNSGAPKEIENPSCIQKKEGEKCKASPLAKRLAKEKGIDLHVIQGTGPGGRIMRRDLEATAVNKMQSITPTSSAPPTQIPLSPVRKVIAERLQFSKRTIPHFYLTKQLRAEKLIDVRLQLKEMGEQISVNDFLIKAAALALKNHPKLNSGFDSDRNAIIRFNSVDIAVAVSINEGVITPLIRQADSKAVRDIAAEMKTLALKAKEGRLRAEEYMGGSFTISNLGMYGIEEFSAIINPPQAAILAVGCVKDAPVVEDGHIVAGKVLSLTLSADHRVVDGADGAEFLLTMQAFLENPATLLL